MTAGLGGNYGGSWGISAPERAVGLMEDRMGRGTARPEDGRGEWLSELYQANARAVESYCRRFLNSAEDAADATHEVFFERSRRWMPRPAAARHAAG